jgi:hypothetical protein
MAASAANVLIVEIVERHFGKHTGLPHSAKACLETCDNANQPQGWRWGRPRRNQQRHGAKRASSVNPGESPWGFRSINLPEIGPAGPEKSGRRQKSRRFRQRKARQ